MDIPCNCEECGKFYWHKSPAHICTTRAELLVRAKPIWERTKTVATVQRKMGIGYNLAKSLCEEISGIDRE
jgi:hypothetical protein